MVLYYTTSAGHEEPQTFVSKSLGGYRSSNIVKNDDFDNLFGEVSTYTARESRDEYIALMLLNTTGSEVTSVTMWFESPDDNYGSMEVAIVRTTTDADGDAIMERTRTKFTRPFTADFRTATEDARLPVGNIGINESLGIWIKRSINRTTIDTTLSTIYERDPNNRDIYRSITLNQTETHNFKIDYT